MAGKQTSFEEADCKGEEMSGKMMDERERLSLSTRATSQNTSRNTSRTASPVVQKKHVKFAIDNRVSPAPDKIPAKSDPEVKTSVTAVGEYMVPDGKGCESVMSSDRTEDLQTALDFQKLKSTKPIVVVSACSPRNPSLVHVGVPSAIEVT